MTMIGKLMLGMAAAGIVATVGLALRGSPKEAEPMVQPVQLHAAVVQPPQIVETVAKPPPTPVDDDDDSPSGS